jgi:hypothetical protein
MQQQDIYSLPQSIHAGPFTFHCAMILTAQILFYKQNNNNM